MHFLSFILVLPAIGLAAATPIIQERDSDCGTMDMNAIQEDLYNATDDLWPDPDTKVTDETRIKMHDQLVQYITEHYSDPCTRDALIFGTDLFFTEPSLQSRDLHVDVQAGPGLDKRRRHHGWGHFVDQMYKVSHEVGHAVEHEVAREVNNIVASAANVITQSVCSSIAGAAAEAVAIPEVTAPAAPYVGTAVYYWCLNKTQKKIKKAVALNHVTAWRSAGGRWESGSLRGTGRQLPTHSGDVNI